MGRNRHILGRQVRTVGLALLVAGGCAAHPERPRPTDASATDAAPPAPAAPDAALDEDQATTTPAPTTTTDERAETSTDAGNGDTPGTVVAPAAPVLFGPWPGPNSVTVVDQKGFFGQNLSGLSYQPATATAAAILWGVENSPSVLYRLEWSGSLYVASTANGWSAGKTLVYPSGGGSPDAEGLTKAEWDSSAIYVSCERDNDAPGTSRLSVLRFDTLDAGTTLTATHEWNLTADLPKVDPNKGIEALTFVPDDYLTAHGFIDESTGRAYVPLDYAAHGTGLFFLGLEGGDRIYAYALDHTAGTFHRVTSFPSGQAEVIDLSFDRDVGTLWSYCDDACGNRATLLDLEGDPAGNLAGNPDAAADAGPGTGSASSTGGRFQLRRAVSAPMALPNAGNEGIAIAPESECLGGLKSFLWADDSYTDHHALRRGSIPCGRLY